MINIFNRKSFGNNLNVMFHKDFIENCIADENITDIIVSEMPGQLNFFEKRKWISYKKSLLLQNTSCKNFVVDKWCIWIYTNQKITIKKWAVLEKVRNLKKVINDISESEIWFLDDGNTKISFCLLKGVLIHFKVIKDFSDELLETFVNHMKNYTFIAPKVRVFGSSFDFNYDVYSYSKDIIERKLDVKIDNLKMKYVKDISDFIKICLINASTLILVSGLIYRFYSSTQKQENDIMNLDNRISLVSKMLSNYPKIDHILDLNYDVSNTKVLQLVSNIYSEYKLEVVSKNKIKLLTKLSNDEMRKINQVSKNIGIKLI